ncbi:MAG: lipopolysaccharide biosynthesis protein [Planctomycetota bacterium]
MPRPPRPSPADFEPPAAAGRAAVEGGVLNVAARAYGLAVQLGATMVLARLVAPAVFGVVSMAAVFSALANLLKDAGLSTATVQRRALSEAELTVLFWCNLGLGVLLTLTFAAAAPLLGWLYRDSRVATAAVLIAGSFAINGAAVQHHALLRRAMRFRALNVIAIVSATLSAGVSVGLAAAGAPYVALTSPFLVGAAVSLIGAWIAAGWRPGRPMRRWREAATSLRFGAQLTLAQVCNLIAQRADRLLLGVGFGAEAVGFYSKSQNLALMVRQGLVQPLASVGLPALSRLQDEPVRFRAAYRRGVEVVAAIAAPVACFTALEAADLVRLLLGARWVEACTSLVRVMAIAAFFESMNAAIGWQLVPLGRGGRQLRLTAWRTAAVLAGMLAGLAYGASGVAVGWAAANALTYVPRLAYAVRGGPARLSDVARALVRPVAVAALGVAVLLLVLRPVTASLAAPVGVLLRGVLFGGMCGALLAALHWATLRRWWQGRLAARGGERDRTGAPRHVEERQGEP